MLPRPCRRLEALPGDIARLGLKKLVLGSNRFKDFPRAVLDMKDLEERRMVHMVGDFMRT